MNDIVEFESAKYRSLKVDKEMNMKNEGIMLIPKDGSNIKMIKKNDIKDLISHLENTYKLFFEEN